MGTDHDAIIHAAHNLAALCTIVGIDGSFSRRCGAQLAVGRDGSFAGDLADNCLHSELANQAEMAAADGAIRLLRYGKDSPFIDFRLPCGSGLDILVDPSPDRGQLASCINALGQRQPASLPLPLPQNAPPALLRQRDYMPDLRLLILGAGPECQALQKLAQTQGIETTWHEAGQGLSLGQIPKNLSADCWTGVLLLFHDHEWEHAILQWALETSAFYIGAQGGAPARDARLARLREAGIDAASLARIHGPVGLIPRARDAHVLALSILADVVASFEALHPHQ